MAYTAWAKGRRGWAVIVSADNLPACIVKAVLTGLTAHYLVRICEDGRRPDVEQRATCNGTH